MEKRIESQHGIFTIRPYENSDEPGVIRLWEAAFGQPMPLDIWRWKFHDNPFGREMMVCLTESGQPVALYGGISYFAVMQEKTGRIVHHMDVMSHPDYRFAVSGRSGLYGTTVQHCLSEIGKSKTVFTSFGFPGYRASRLGKLLYNYKTLGSGVSYLQCSTENLRSLKSSYWRKTEPVGPKDQVCDEIQLRLKKYYSLTVKRNHRFISWRYFHNPKNHYRIFAGKTILGGARSFMVFTFQNNIATLVDLLVPDSSLEISQLFAGVAEEIKNIGCDLIRTWLPSNHFTTKILREIGFTALPEPLGIIPTVIIYQHGLTYEFIDRNLFYTMGDADLF